MRRSTQEHFVQKFCDVWFFGFEFGKNIILTKNHFINVIYTVFCLEKYICWPFKLTCLLPKTPELLVKHSSSSTPMKISGEIYFSWIGPTYLQIPEFLGYFFRWTNFAQFCTSWTTVNNFWPRFEVVLAGSEKGARYSCDTQNDEQNFWSNWTWAPGDPARSKCQN